jgi:hypothetical protein
MRIGLNRSALRKLRPAELAWRFVLGGAITTAAGLIAELYGPAIGGLFLAFPAILPASLTLVAKHQEDRKRQHGLRGVVRGRHAAALDAFGALLGCGDSRCRDPGRCGERSESPRDARSGERHLAGCCHRTVGIAQALIALMIVRWDEASVAGARTDYRRLAGKL